MKLTKSTARRYLKGRESGYTLIEMVMVIVIMGLITVAISQTIAQTVRISQPWGGLDDRHQAGRGRLSGG